MNLLRKSFVIGKDSFGKQVKVLLENGEFQPTLVLSRDSSRRDSLVRLLLEGYSASGVPSLVITNGERFSGLARPAKQRKSNDNLLPRGFPTASVNIAKLQSKEYRFSVDALGAKIIGTLLDCNRDELQQLKCVFDIAREQQRQLDTLNQLQAVVAWALENKSSIPSWIGKIESEKLAAVQEKLIRAMSVLPSHLFCSEHFPTQPFFKQDFVGSGTITLLDIELEALGDPGALLLTLGILKKLAESLDYVSPGAFIEGTHPLVIVITEPELSSLCPADKLIGILRLLKLKNIAVYFCFEDILDVELSLIDLCRNHLHAGEIQLAEARSQQESTRMQDFRHQARVETPDTNGAALIDRLDQIKSEPHTGLLGSFSKMWHSISKAKTQRAK